MFRKILLDTKNRERLFEDSVRDNFGKSIKEDLFHEVEIKVENMQEAYNISKKKKHKRLLLTSYQCYIRVQNIYQST